MTMRSPTNTHEKRKGFSRVEPLVDITIITILVGVLLPAVQFSRESARRVQCSNNLKQLALAMASYESASGTLPLGFWYQIIPQGPLAGSDNSGPDVMVALTLYLEQIALYNACNTQLDQFVAQNSTVSGIGINALWCPSDGAIVGLSHTYPGSVAYTDDGSPLTTYYSSYAVNLGTWTYFPDYQDPYFTAKLNAMNGVISYVGFPNWLKTVNGHFNRGSIGPVKLSSVTDGYSNTIAFGEHAHGLIRRGVDPSGYVDFYDFNWWASNYYGDTSFTTLYPLNPSTTLSNIAACGSPGDALALAASSFHPGGANFAFLDGSV
jgi:prepilin-type processing-associated H-X9-DG protein